MTDDLVKRLRDFTCDCFSGNSKHMAWDAANRIEELEALVRQYRDAVAQIGHWIKTGEVPR